MTLDDLAKELQKRKATFGVAASGVLWAVSVVKTDGSRRTNGVAPTIEEAFEIALEKWDRGDGPS